MGLLTFCFFFSFVIFSWGFRLRGEGGIVGVSFAAFAIERGRIELVERSAAPEPLRQIRVGDEQGERGL
jgi:hypothetical protein